jgi:hypothetical protein
VKLMLSGEGPTDLGANRPVEGGNEFVPGPMAELVDKCCHMALGYSLLEHQHLYGGDVVVYFSRGDLSQRKNKRERRAPILSGVKRPAGLGGITAQAWTLGILAVEEARKSGDRVVAILFHDSDGTRAVGQDHWSEQVAAIKQGFARAECMGGVAMVPRPKSEAWLICALRQPHYQHCAALEESAGNDGSPNSLKAMLAALNGGEYPSADVQAAWVRDGVVDPRRIDMPSFAAFRHELAQACSAALTRNTNNTTQAGAA